MRCAEGGTSHMAHGGSVGILQGIPEASSKAPKEAYGGEGGMKMDVQLLTATVMVTVMGSFSEACHLVEPIDKSNSCFIISQVLFCFK